MRRNVWNSVAAAALLVAAIAFATAYRGAQASPGPAASASIANAQASTVTITNITSTCAESQLCGTLSVTDPVEGATVELKVFANPKDGSCQAFCVDTGASTVVTLHAGQTDYNFCIPVAAEFNDPNVYNSLRVEVGSTSGADFTGTTTKGPSVHCTDQTPTAPTETPVPPTETPVPPTDTPVPTETPTIPAGATDTPVPSITPTEGEVTEVPPKTPTETSAETEVPQPTATSTEPVGGVSDTPTAPASQLPSTGATNSSGGSGTNSLALLIGFIALALTGLALRQRRSA